MTLPTNERTQPCTVVGGLCAFSAKNRNLARLPPLDSPTKAPRANAAGGSTSNLCGRCTEMADSSSGTRGVAGLFGVEDEAWALSFA